MRIFNVYEFHTTLSYPPPCPVPHNIVPDKLFTKPRHEEILASVLTQDEVLVVTNLRHTLSVVTADISGGQRPELRAGVELPPVK